jgi:hypothetical protein
MAKKQIQLSIPEPCHENWHAMTPREQGRYCGSCAKTVVDFSLMSDGQIMETIKKAGGGLCGHFHNDQLNRAIVAPPKPKWWLQPVWQYIIGGLLFLKPALAKAQKPAMEQGAPRPATVRGEVAVPQQQDSIIVKGKITNEFGEALSLISVTVNNEKKVVSVLCNSKGYFKIKAVRGQLLTITGLGYSQKQVVASDIYENIQLIHDKSTVDGLLLVSYKSADDEEAVLPKLNKIIYVVKNALSGQAIPHATVSWKKDTHAATENTQSNKKGRFKISDIGGGDVFDITVDAKGFQTKTFKINGRSLGPGKNLQTIALAPVAKEKVPVTITRSVNIANEYNQSRPKLQQPGSVNIQPIYKGALVQPFTLTGRVGGVNIAAVRPVSKKVNPIADTKKPVAHVTDMRIQPNPVVAGNAVAIRYTGTQSETMLLQVTEADGKILSNQKCQAVKGDNVFSLQTEPS